VSRATQVRLATVKAIDPPRPKGSIAPGARAANDEVPVEAASGQAAVTELPTWIDALARTLAAGFLAGASGLDREVMDADELAAFLGVDRKTVYDYAGRGQIPHRRLGKRLLFSRPAIVAWLAPCKAASREG
jgi:excisionase family DNA binding protein